MEPLAIGILAALTPSEHEVIFFDSRCEPIDYDLPADLVAMSVQTFTARSAYEIARAYRRRGVPVVMGGFHPTLVPDEALEHADAICAGPAEGVWPEVVRDAKAGSLRRVYVAPDGDHRIVAPRREVFRGKGYAPISTVEYGRGCVHSCEFCSVTAFYGGRQVRRSVDDVVREIRELDRRVLFFADDNIVSDREAAAALFEALVPLKVRWAAQTSVNIARDEEILDLAARSGCFSLTIGFESLDAANLRQMRKSWNTEGMEYGPLVERIRRKGIMVYGTFAFGYDNDTPASFGAVQRFAGRHKLFLTNFINLMPFPSTPLYERLAAEGRLLDGRWWLNPSHVWGSVAFLPRRMSPGDLARGCQKARERFYGATSIIRRFCDRRANARSWFNAAAFWGANLVSRRETRRKYGVRLGSGRELERCP
jgi:radical SAM superfamily enzyme YgiQ (UPF0313 family)